MLLSVLNEGLLDIFAISESKLDDSFPLCQFSVTDFSIHRNDRNRYGGGIMLYVRSNYRTGVAWILSQNQRFLMVLNSL